MGYFSNGTEGMDYAGQYCDNCIHQPIDPNDGGCPVLLAHYLHNYEECNNPDSILHILIPRDEQGYNEKCKMFIPRE